MIVGIVSDTHDNLPKIRAAVSALKEKNVEVVLHAGDVNSAFAAREFASLGCRFVATFGNNDGDRLLLYKTITGFGGEVIYPRVHLRLGDKQLALFHGEDTSLVESVASSELYDYVVVGHTHEVVQRRVGKTLLLNPGECCAYLTGKSTLMILDTIKDAVSLQEL
jgi:putative phosphoesterase